MKTANTALTLLNAALPLVPSHGFTRACLLEAAHTTQLPITTQTLDGLFPSTPASHDGPTSALLQHWLAQQTSLTCDHMMASTDKPITLAKGLAYRLALNEPMKYRLRTVWSHRVFGLALPDLKAFTNHAARTTQAVEKAASMSPKDTLSLSQRSRLSLIYAAAEWSQFSDASPDSRVSHHLLQRLLERHQQTEHAKDEVALFGSHIFKTWQGLYKSTYL